MHSIPLPPAQVEKTLDALRELKKLLKRVAVQAEAKKAPASPGPAGDKNADDKNSPPSAELLLSATPVEKKLLKKVCERTGTNTILAAHLSVDARLVCMRLSWTASRKGNRRASTWSAWASRGIWRWYVHAVRYAPCAVAHFDLLCFTWSICAQGEKMHKELKDANEKAAQERLEQEIQAQKDKWEKEDLEVMSPRSPAIIPCRLFPTIAST